MTKARILIVDDEENLQRLLARVIGLEGYHVSEAGTSKAALRILEQESIQVVISDVKLPDANGVDLTAKIKSQFPHIEVIVLTAYGTIEDGVRAIKNGAFDYLTKGDHQEKIIPLVSKASDKAILQQKVRDLQAKLTGKIGFDTIIGSDVRLMQVIELARKVAVTDTTVLLLGETGVGKEVFAQAIHSESNRSANTIVAVNCSAFAKDLLESELFGSVEGAFTGATKSRRGLVEEANDGTLFLDEIGEMNLDVQAKFLRVLETGEFYRVGDSKVRKVNIRIIAATNRDLEQEAEAGRFRRDLYYRLSVFTLTIPPLRERRADIKPLANFFCKQFAAKTNKQVFELSDEFVMALESHPWKGNIRELKNVIERCVILTASTTLTEDLLPFDFSTSTIPNTFDLATAEKLHIQKVLRHTNGNKTEAARLLDIALTTLYRKLEERR